VTLLFGKYPHPSALFPAGIGIVADADVYQQVLGRFNRLLDYSKKVTAVWDDLVTFFQQSVEPFERSGESAHSLVSFGLWDDPEAGDDRPDRAGQPSYRRYSTPGVVVGRQLVATDLPSIERRLAEQGRPGFESGPIARLWITAVSGQFRNEFIECQTGRDSEPALRSAGISGAGDLSRLAASGAYQRAGEESRASLPGRLCKSDCPDLPAEVI